MSAFTSVSIYNNLPTRKSGIPVRTANHEFSRRIYMQNQLIVEKSFQTFGKFGYYTGNQDVLYIFKNYR